MRVSPLVQNWGDKKMVDFNDSMTVAIPAYDIVKILILQSRDNFIQALEAYRRTKYKGIQASSHEIQSRIQSLYEEVRSAMKNSMSEEEFDKLTKSVESAEYDMLIESWHIIDEWLYVKKLIQFDTKIRYDSSRTEIENDMKNIT